MIATKTIRKKRGNMNKLAKILGVAVVIMGIAVGSAAYAASTTTVVDPSNPNHAPKISPEINGTVFKTTRPKFSGTTFPNSRVDIYIYSEPIHGVTYSDSKGYWEWTPDQDIPPGKHTIQATVTDSKGNKSMASVAYTFEIASDAKSPASTSKEVAGAATSATTNWVTYTIWGLVVIFLLVGGYAITRRRKTEE